MILRDTWGQFLVCGHDNSGGTAKMMILARVTVASGIDFRVLIFR